MLLMLYLDVYFKFRYCPQKLLLKYTEFIIFFYYFYTIALANVNSDKKTWRRPSPQTQAEALVVPYLESRKCYTF